GVDEVDETCLPGQASQQRRARLGGRAAGQQELAGGGDREAGQGGDAVAPAGAVIDAGGELDPGEAAAAGERLGVVLAAAAGVADVDLLQGDDVGRIGGDDRGDPAEVDLVVGAAAVADVVGHQAERGRGGHGGSKGEGSGGVAPAAAPGRAPLFG